MKPSTENECSLPGLFMIHHNMPMKSYEEHSHDGPECIIPLFGGIKVTPTGSSQMHSVMPGQMIMIPKNLQHAAVSDERQGERLILLVKEDLIDFDKIKVLPRSQLLVELVFECFESEDKALLGHANKIILSLLAKFAATKDSYLVNTQKLLALAQDERVKKALSFFEANPGTEMSIAEIAAKCGLSERSMQRLFKDELGLSPNGVLVQYRIEMAIKLLRRGETVTEACFAVGYSSMSQFIAQFRSVTGRLPSDFLK